MNPQPPELQPGDTFTDCADCPTMAVIPAGNFTQGSPASEPESSDRERPRRQVNVPAFAMGQTEVTFEQWDACVADGGCMHNPGDGGWGRGNRPVIYVSWEDAQEYVTWLSNKTGQPYRLPSESEWEYAARAGTTGRFNTGDCITTDQAYFNGYYPAQGCPAGIRRLQTLPVASFAPNAFGLYDTHGNVSEWVQDCPNDSYVGAPTDGSPWMTGDCLLDGIPGAISRGGSYASFGDHGLRSAARSAELSMLGSPQNGFRVARSVTQNGGTLNAPAHLSYPETSTTGQFTVNWTPVQNASSYHLERSADGVSSWSRVYSGNQTSHPESVGNGAYHYRVRAVDAQNQSHCTVGANECVVTIVESTFAISIQQHQTPAYQPVVLGVAGDRPLDTLTWQIDVSGSAAFSPEDTLEGPLLIQDNEGLFVPPPVFLFQLPGAQSAYHIRLLADDGAISTTLLLQQQRPQLSGLTPGIASTALQLIIKAVYAELADPVLAAASGQIQPRVTVDLLHDLDDSLTMIDEHAAALLLATFGEPSTSGLMAVLSKQSLPGLNGYSRTFDCLSNSVSFSGNYATSADDCWSVAIGDVRDNIGGITSLTERFSTGVSAMASLVRHPVRATTNYVQRLKMSTAVTNVANEYAQLALRLPPFEADPEFFQFMLPAN